MHFCLIIHFYKIVDLDFFCFVFLLNYGNIAKLNY